MDGDAFVLLDKLGRTATTACRVCRGHMLVVNFAAGKTEAVVALHGLHVSQARDRLAAAETVGGVGGAVLVLALGGQP